MTKDDAMTVAEWPNFDATYANLAGVVDEIKAIAPDVQYTTRENGTVDSVYWARMLSDEDLRAISALLQKAAGIR